MKLDMHCHTKEGSIDAKVPIQEYITKLVKEGFDGMLVTDHNSYDGYRKFEKIAKNLHLEKPFTVLKGIEYDTRDGGHVIAVLPDCINDAFMEKLDGKSIYSENIELEYEFDNLILDILETKNIDNDEKGTLIDYMEQEYGNVKSNPELFKRIEDVCKINK